MHATNICASTRKCGLVAATKIHLPENVVWLLLPRCIYQKMWSGCCYKDASTRKCGLVAATKMHLPENVVWLLLPRCIYHKMWSGCCYKDASTRKCGLDEFAKLYQERRAEYVDQTYDACYKHMNLQEKLLPSHIKKVLSTMIIHVMHAAKYMNLLENFTLDAFAKIYQERVQSTLMKHGMHATNI